MEACHWLKMTSLTWPGPTVGYTGPRGRRHKYTMAAMKRMRAANMSLVEKNMLVDIALRYENTIENKRTDGVSVVEKATAWANIATDFNAVSVIKREASSLKQVCYRRLYASRRSSSFLSSHAININGRRYSCSCYLRV